MDTNQIDRMLSRATFKHRQYKCKMRKSLMDGESSSILNGLYMKEILYLNETIYNMENDDVIGAPPYTSQNTVVPNVPPTPPPSPT